jgi:hypothetical protein
LDNSTDGQPRARCGRKTDTCECRRGTGQGTTHTYTFIYIYICNIEEAARVTHLRDEEQAARLHTSRAQACRDISPQHGGDGVAGQPASQTNATEKECGGQKCDLCFEFSWFKPLIIQDMTLIFSEGVFKAKNTKIDHLSKMFFNLDPASIYVDSFDLEWQKRESTPILKAGLNPLILSIGFPLNANIVFENGKIKQSLSQEALSGVKGYIYYKDKQPIDFHIEGRSAETGFIDLKGHLDFLSQSASIDLIGKDCPKKNHMQ